MVGPIRRSKAARIVGRLSAHESGRGGGRELVIRLPWEDTAGEISSGELKLHVKGNFAPTDDATRMMVTRTMEFALKKFIEALHPDKDVQVTKCVTLDELNREKEDK